MVVEKLKERVIKKAKSDSRVRVVMLNGSRANHNGEIDQFSDLDIVYFVNDYIGVLKDNDFFEHFGEVLISQSKEEQLFPQTSDFLGYIKMMQFKDGTRLDLSIVDVNDMEDAIKNKDYYQCLLDKDDYLEGISLPNRSVFTIDKPSEDYFKANVKQFYWLSFYVVKGVERGMYPYAIEHLALMREAFEAMAAWYVGAKFGWEIELGKAGKYLPKYLSKHDYNKYLKTYPLATQNTVYKAMMDLMELFDDYVNCVARKLNYQIGVNHQEILFAIDNYRKLK